MMKSTDRPALTDHQIPRRTFLKGALAASAASPFLILPGRTRAAQSGPLPPALPASERVNLACKGQERCRSSFDVSGPLSQVLVLGVIAQRLNTKLTFDRKTQQITGNAVANQLLAGPPPRKGWEEYYRL